MCGIVGFHNSSQEEVGLDCLQAMAHTIRYRGPDDEGYYLNGRIGLGHVRLSILDLSPKGKQPMKSRYSNRTIVFNGEIYNYLELRQELVQKGYAFSTQTDTEVLLYALEAWGIDKTLQKINGMYAFAYWIEEEDKLILVRDRLGKKPLYYYHRGAHLVFASELKALLKYPFVSKEVDPAALYQYFLYHYVPSPSSIVKCVQKLLPGHYLEYSKAKATLQCYWQLPNGHESNHLSSRDLENSLGELSALLKSSVQYRLISDVPLGIFLSGGIDSSVITALAIENSGQPLRTFSVGFRESNFDESPIAKKVASHFGTRHNEYYLQASDILPNIEDIIGGLDEPLGDSSFIPTYYVSKMAKQQITVALEGDGGDELFGGYSKYRRLHQLQKIKMFLPKNFRKQILRFFSVATKKRKLGGLMKGLNSEVPFSRLDELYKKVEDRHLADAMMHIDLQTYLPDDILTKVDRASMANALEVRAPLLDYRIVEYVSQLPIQFKIAGGIQKILFKRLLKKYIPDHITNRKKMGFCLPIDLWLRRDLKFLLEKYLSPQAIRRVGFFKDEKITQIVQEHVRGVFDHSKELFTVLAYQIWHDRYIERLIG